MCGAILFGASTINLAFCARALTLYQTPPKEKKQPLNSTILSAVVPDLPFD